MANTPVNKFWAGHGGHVIKNNFGGVLLFAGMEHFFNHKNVIDSLASGVASHVGWSLLPMDNIFAIGYQAIEGGRALIGAYADQARSTYNAHNYTNSILSSQMASNTRNMMKGLMNQHIQSGFSSDIGNEALMMHR